MAQMPLCRLAPAALAAALVLSACAGGSPIAAAAPPVEGAVEHGIAATDFAFAPEEITVTAGEPVNLRLVNEGRSFHDIASADLDFRVDARPGSAGTGSFVADRSGSYELICTVPGHADQGMTMTLVVEDR
jgi:uncharacterized cupredoxin-like copper-binding protein